MHENVDKMEILQYFDINILSPLLRDEGVKLLSVYIIGKQFFFILPQDSIYNNSDKKDGAVIAIIDVKKGEDDDNETFALRI